jgi:hypothetical protein
LIYVVIIINKIYFIGIFILSVKQSSDRWHF